MLARLVGDRGRKVVDALVDRSAGVVKDLALGKTNSKSRNAIILTVCSLTMN